MTRIGIIINPKSKRNGLLVEILDVKHVSGAGTCQFDKTFYKVKFGDGLTIWTLSENVS